MIDMSRRFDGRTVANRLLADDGEVEGRSRLPRIDWASTGRPDLAPQMGTLPPTADHDRLPRAAVVIMTWTADEWEALHHVFAGGVTAQNWRRLWRPYRRDFHTVFADLWSHRLIQAHRNRRGGVPALASAMMRWGSYVLTRVGHLDVLLFKSDLHLNQDGQRFPLPQLTRQIVEDARPRLVLSIGTAGGVSEDQVLGDAMVTTSALFKLSDEFSGAGFNNRQYTSTWRPPTSLVSATEPLLLEIPELPVPAPTPHYPAAALQPGSARRPRITMTSLPIITTDRFEFGNTTDNRMDTLGCAVEMDDAVIAMELEEIKARGGPEVSYGFVRNVSDPIINGRLSRAMQMAWAVVTYYRAGLATSFNGALATWVLTAGVAAEGGDR